MPTARMQVQPSRETVQPSRLYEAYAAGDYGAVGDALPDREAWRAFERPLFRAVDAWKAEVRATRGAVWKAARVALLIEIGSLVMRLERGDAPRVMAAARELVTMRAGAPGADDGEIDAGDRFEIAVHRTAVAVLWDESGEAREYLRAIENRIAAFRRTVAGQRLVARLDLADALLLESATRPFVREAFFGAPPAPTPQSVATARANAEAERAKQALDLRLKIEAAIKALPSHANLPADIQAEVEVRRGILQFRLDEPDLALASIELGLSHSRESSVRYWGLMFAARIAAIRGRNDVAIRHYEDAVRMGWPRSQTAAVALASTYFLAGDRPQAEAWARIGRTISAGTDPWWAYWYADQRFGQALITEIRSSFR